MGCGCEQSDLSSFQVVDYEEYSSLVQSLGLAQPAALGTMTVGSDTYDTHKFFLVDSKMAVAAGTQGGERGCATIPLAGIPVRMCWNIQGTISLPIADVTIALTFSLGNVVYYSVTYRVKCSNLPDLSSCEAELVTETVNSGAFAIKGCNWRCLRRCAPGCISCGTNYWCWAGCAASCVLRCC